MSDAVDSRVIAGGVARPVVSVAICTWNRRDLLEETLASLAAMSPLPDGEWEVVVVDNNSTDGTAEVCTAFAESGRLPLRVVPEPQQGHSHSRNRAAAEARGEFVVWTDDDVRVSAGWLTAYRAAIERHPEACFFGGPIEPEFEGPLPRWLAENRDVCDGVYARRQLGDRERELDASTLPYGANFATRRSVLTRFPFRPCFGRAGRSVRGYDEIDVLNRILESGARGWWVPEAPLQHRIPADRMTTRYIRDYFFGQGQTWVARGAVQPTAEELKRQIRYHQRRAGWMARLIRPSREWFGHWVQLANLRGQLDQLLAGNETAESPVAGAGLHHAQHFSP